MNYETIVGLQVTDEALYSTYREKMLPILESHGGGFRYDFKLAEVLKNESGNPMNRVFAIFFGDKQLMQKFFDNAEYLAIKEKYFSTSVQAMTIISEYDRL